MILDAYGRATRGASWIVPVWLAAEARAMAIDRAADQRVMELRASLDMARNGVGDTVNVRLPKRFLSKDGNGGAA